MAKERIHADRFPFSDIEMVPRKPRKNFIRRFWLKHVRKLPALYYRGELQRGSSQNFPAARGRLMHIYFGHTGVHLLPLSKGGKNRASFRFMGLT